jgi:hypothetical protein
MANGWSMGWGGSDDGDEVDEPAAEHPWERPHGAPDNEVPVTVPLDRMLAATGDVAVYVAAMSVYSNGAAFTVEVRVRPRARIDALDDVWESVHGHARGADRLLLGVEFADGRRCSNLEGPFGSVGGVSLSPGGSSGSPRSASADWYLAPLPPPGELRLYCAWPGAGIEETVTVLDAGPILEAAGRVRELWPWESPVHDGRPVAKPEVPAAGWFASFAEPGE